jgi:hypothetical protein
MTKPIYRFDTQLARGEWGEAVLDDYYCQWCHITQATKRQQFIGIDRLFTTMHSGKQWDVQYKTDFKVQIYGNLIVETVSNNVTETLGWGYTCEADVIIWLLWYTGEMLVLQPRHIRQGLSKWQKKYHKAVVQNDGYQTIGVKVPLDEVRRYSWWQGYMPTDYLQKGLPQ